MLGAPDQLPLVVITALAGTVQEQHQGKARGGRQLAGLARKLGHEPPIPQHAFRLLGMLVRTELGEEIGVLSRRGKREQDAREKHTGSVAHDRGS